MKFKNLAYATFVAAAAVAFVIGSAVPSEAAKEEGGSRGTAAAPAARLLGGPAPVCATKGDHEVHLSQRLLRRERRREGLPSRVHAKQRPSQGRRQEKGKEEKVIRNSA